MRTENPDFPWRGFEFPEVRERITKIDVRSPNPRVRTVRGAARFAAAPAVTIAEVAELGVYLVCDRAAQATASMHVVSTSMQGSQS